LFSVAPIATMEIYYTY